MIICSMDFHTLRHPSQSNRQQSSPHPRIDRYNNNDDDDRGAFQLLHTRHRIIKRKRSSSNPLSSLEEVDEGGQVVSCCVLCQTKKVKKSNLANKRIWFLKSSFTMKIVAKYFGTHWLLFIHHDC